MSFIREKLENKFREEYERLNEMQRLAVDTIDGPVMVIAGPGTGKTQILASRVGKILLETDAQPENILCLTYTDAGVVAMRKRLLQFIGSDAYKVNIYTFHAFCNDVIQENLSLFEKTALDPISDLERIELFKELIDSFPKNHLLKRYRGDVYFEINNLQQLFSAMKREGWTPAYINKKIDDYIADITSRDEFIYKRKFKEFNAGDLKKDKIEEEKERKEKLRAAVNEFDRFQQMMRKRNRYDFDDMINWVIKAFEENKNLLATYQEKFLYILVDEYQDTSGTQNRIVSLLINYWEKPNVFVVGDDDQSIYRFQGANVENMINFADSYKKDLMTVVLTNNYRSTQPILDISKTLIDKNTERLVQKLPGLSKDLRSSHHYISTLTHTPVIKEYETQRQEMIHLTLQIQKLLEEGIPAGNIAIIYKENKYGSELAQYFKLKNIPVYTKRNINILELPLAKKIISIIKYLAAEHDVPYGGDEMLFEILHFDWFRIPAVEIAKLSVENSEKKYAEKTSLRRLLHEKSNAIPKDLFSTTVHEGLKKASFILEKLISDVPNITLQQLFEYVFFAGCNASFWEKKRKPGGGYSLPDTMFSSQPGSKDDEELRRLFYVALTRAEKHLFISFSRFKNDGKDLEPSMFIAEILDRHLLPAEKVFLSEEILSEFSALQFGEAEAPEIEKIEKDLMDRLLDKFVMNVTALNNYLKCPLEFYFKNLIRIPSPKNEATEFGSAVHYALEQLFRKMQDGGKEQFPSKENFVTDFEWHLHRHRESFTQEQFARRLEYGQEVLSNYYDNRIASFNKIVAIERNIRNVVVKGIPIKGKLDKLEFDGKSVNVVDYKTGDPDKALPKLKGPSDKEPNGGDYWRQGVFYKILVDNYEQKDWKVVSTEFDFIEPDKKKNYRK